MTTTNTTNLIVLIKYKTQPEKHDIALSELKNLISKVQEEPNYVNIIIHADPMDPSNILLYEEWSNEEYFKGDHLNTSHLRQFMMVVSSFLAGPPEISFWNIR